jgi:hypothetical protein
MDQRPSFSTDSMASIALLLTKMHFYSQILPKKLGLSTLFEQVATCVNYLRATRCNDCECVQ